MDDLDRTQKIERMTRNVQTIPLVCSWCKKIYRLEKHEYEHNKMTGVSHGICPECLQKQDDLLK
ncbi:MAG: hypothetical protein A2X49_08835 [Lentisphaerae bacterium GWF2_52_8]|nr:MAG: hypothetical protein A2X49_08835 [Lentisphaerae bacterium GWF2_52_8]